tara:strand:- start:521 stop:760 length:240 start_codon:yes stop_codon:yes gene_type:complete
MKDKINPDYYVGTRIQVSDFISEFNLNYFEGNIVKYIVRHRDKNGIEDLKKARWYLDRLIKKEEKAKPDEDDLKVGLTI